MGSTGTSSQYISAHPGLHVHLLYIVWTHEPGGIPEWDRTLNAYFYGVSLPWLMFTTIQYIYWWVCETIFSDFDPTRLRNPCYIYHTPWRGRQQRVLEANRFSVPTSSPCIQYLCGLLPDVSIGRDVVVYILTSSSGRPQLSCCYTQCP